MLKGRGRKKEKDMRGMERTEKRQWQNEMTGEGVWRRWRREGKKIKGWIEEKTDQRRSTEWEGQKSHFWWTAAGNKGVTAVSPPVYNTVYHHRAIRNRTSRASQYKHRTKPWPHWELHSHGWTRMILFTNTSHVSHICCPGSSRIDHVITFDCLVIVWWTLYL